MTGPIARCRQLAAEIDEIFGPGTARRDAVWCVLCLIGGLVSGVGVLAIAGGN